MLKEEKALRTIIPTYLPNYDHRKLSRLIGALVRAVREDCIVVYLDYLDRPTKFNGLSFENALRKGMRWRANHHPRK